MKCTRHVRIEMYVKVLTIVDEDVAILWPSVLIGGVRSKEEIRRTVSIKVQQGPHGFDGKLGQVFIPLLLYLSFTYVEPASFLLHLLNHSLTHASSSRERRRHRAKLKSYKLRKI